MAKLVIKDLTDSVELDRQAMAAIVGGARIGARASVAVQVAPGASVVVHVVDATAKSAEAAGGCSVAGPVPELVTVTVCAADVALTAVVAKVSAAGDSDTCGTPVPVPLSVTEA